MSEEYIVGEVLATFFENPQNFYKVLLIRVQESSMQLDSDEIVVTGIIGTIHDNSIVLMEKSFRIQNMDNSFPS